MPNFHRVRLWSEALRRKVQLDMTRDTLRCGRWQCGDGRVCVKRRQPCKASGRGTGAGQWEGGEGEGGSGEGEEGDGGGGEGG